MTRDQWLEIWAAIKYVEMHELLSNRSRKELNKVKDLVQKEVGHLE